VRRALTDTDLVLHLAARVGVGQSMYEVADYTDVNSRGTAVLLEAMIERAKRRTFDRLSQCREQPAPPERRLL
jgi:nucleoside-diphosphate-sugar epimerase